MDRRLGAQLNPVLQTGFWDQMESDWLGAELGINGRLARKLMANRRRCGSGVRREVAGRWEVLLAMGVAWRVESAMAD